MKKNIIILHTDQQRYDSLKCNGNKYAKTDNIDALAADGSRFTRHISANPTCSPSRASLLTGLHTPGHGLVSNGMALWRRDGEGKVIDNTISQRVFGINVEDKVPTLADILGDQGYKTALFGKLHLEPHLADKSYEFYENYGTWNEEEAKDRKLPFYGFQTHKIILGHGEQPCGYNRGHYGRWLHKHHSEIVKLVTPGENMKTSLPGDRDDIYLSEIPSKFHNTMWLADEVCNYIEEHESDVEPIFMFVGFPDPHHPFTPPKDSLGDFMDIPTPDFASKEDIVGEKCDASKKAMDMRSASKKDCELAYKYTMASVHLIDEAIGKIIKQLKDKDMYDDTIIVFTSDHGDYLGDFDMLAKSDLPFLNLVHLPFIIKGTKDQDLPKEVNTPMSNVDVVPTLLNMVGAQGNDYIQGVDIYDENNSNNKPMVTCFGLTCDERNISILNDEYRYTYYLDTKEEELYNHMKDPKELNNLVNDPFVDVKDLCADMKQELLAKHVDCHIGVYNHYSMW